MIKTIKREIKKSRYWVLGGLAGLPLPSFARGSGVTIVSIIENITDYLTGDVARVTGTLAVVGAGYLYLVSNQIQKSTFIKIAVGMGIILGGSTLADQFWG